MTEIRIPTGPLSDAPWDAIRSEPSQAAAMRQALTQALDGIELGTYDRAMFEGGA